MSSSQPLNCLDSFFSHTQHLGQIYNNLTTRVEQEHPGDDVEEGGRLPNALPDEDVGAPLPGQPAGQLWVTSYNFLVQVNSL